MCWVVFLRFCDLMVGYVFFVVWLLCSVLCCVWALSVRFMLVFLFFSFVMFGCWGCFFVFWWVLFERWWWAVV